MSGNAWGLGFSASELLFDTGQGSYQLYQAREQIRIAGFNGLEAELVAAQRIAVDFLTVLRNQAREKLSAELVAQARRNLDLAQALDLASTQRPTLAAASAQVRVEVDSARAAWQSAGEQLLKDYPTGFETVHALRGVSFAVEPGEMVASMGPSGSGKSTMMNVLGLLDRATAGTYIDAGVDTIASSRAALLAK